jgi:cell division protein FtsB
MLTWILLAGAGALLINAIVGENGYVATLQLERSEAAMTRELALTRLENQRLKSDRERLQTDPEALEETIRRELGFIRPGEVAVIVHDVPPVAPVPPQ